MVSTGVKIVGTVSALIVLAAILYKKHETNSIHDRLDHVLSGLLRAERKVSQTSTKARVALGFGSCSDIFVDALPVFNKLNLIAPDEPEHFDSVNSTDSLAKLAAYFFRYGAAAERYVSNTSLFETIVSISDTVAGRRWALGGNAPAMANRMALEGLDVLLGSRLTPNLASSISPNIKVTGKSVKDEDVHVVLEYKTGEKWGKYISPRANRLILHSDNSNPYLKALEDFQREIKSFNPSLIVVGGLQMMDNFPFEAGQRIARLEKLKNLLKQTPSTTKIHFEMASFTDGTLLEEVYENVMLHSDSLGMNEQELPNLASLLTEGKITLVSEIVPRVATVLDQMRVIYKNMKNHPKSSRKLSRLHVHTLAYQAILTKKSSSWKNTMSAAAKAALTAHRYVCGSNYINLVNAKILMDDSFARSVRDSSNKVNFRENRPVSCWDEDDYEICVAPVLVCTNILQTAGGGDNISSAGLVLQI
ncbi:hypothetical protein LOTGIDRAFT_118992 [Lottia gigantea]|uniref:ADP-dependent glucokinase n=1 Tax=Lottia gigantea TaxID=225164 RepID=V4AJ90_LOTGI|nr:hypothetical protein LOTGIDRAFT_118992 [Lottia gigantea]ESO93611.1 hypothetical protein LOTGIDRAFT_118992 [Lottia gigantea]